MRMPRRREPTPWGTQRRLQALANRGWSAQAIEVATGIPAADITAAISDQLDVSPGIDRQVAGAYDLLWNRPPPLATPRDRQLARAARATADQYSWPPPQGWDDEVIDLPDGRPAPGWKPSRRALRRSVDLDEDMSWVCEHGGYRDAPLSVIAARLGVTRAALEKRTPARPTARPKRAEPAGREGSSSWRTSAGSLPTGCSPHYSEERCRGANPGAPRPGVPGP